MKQKGQSLVEFALIVPMLVALGLSVIYIGLLYVDYTQYSNAARDAAREISILADISSDYFQKAKKTDLERYALARQNVVDKINATQNITPGDFDVLESTIIGQYQRRFMGTYWPVWSAQFYTAETKPNSNDLTFKETNTALGADAIEIKIELKLLDTDDNGNYILATDKKSMSPWGGSWDLLPKTLQPVTYKMFLDKK